MHERSGIYTSSAVGRSQAENLDEMAGFCESADKLYGQFMPMKSGLFAVSRRFSRSEFELADEGLVATVDDELEGAGECGGQGDLAVEVD